MLEIVLVQTPNAEYEVSVPLHPQLSQPPCEAVQRLQQLLPHVDASELAYGRVVLLWDKVVQVPNEIW
jgi:hypothetical protein